MAIKRIPIESVTVGMYLCGIDQSWLNTPFLLHRFFIKTQSDIEKLKKCGIHEVDIDTDRGLDVLGPSLVSTVPVPAPSVIPAITPEDQRINHLPPEMKGLSLANELTSIKHTREQLLEGVQDLLDSLAKTGGVEIQEFYACTQTIMEETLNHEEAYVALIQAREFSPVLYDHTLAVSTLSILLGRAAGLDDGALQQLGTAGLLHDVGLFYLPTQLYRPLKELSPSELSVYHTHPQRGFDVLARNPHLPTAVLKLVQEHHEALDGSGYPAKRSSDKLETSSRILRIVDEYDELLSGHQTGDPLSVREALQQLYQKGKRGVIDPVLVSQFVNVIGIYPTYSLIELSTGERGIVTANSRDNLLHPTILLIQDSQHQPLADPIPFNFSTLQAEAAKPEIVDVLTPEEAGIAIESVLTDWVML